MTFEVQINCENHSLVLPPHNRRKYNPVLTYTITKKEFKLSATYKANYIKMNTTQQKIASEAAVHIQTKMLNTCMIFTIRIRRNKETRIGITLNY